MVSYFASYVIWLVLIAVGATAIAIGVLIVVRQRRSSSQAMPQERMILHAPDAAADAAVTEGGDRVDLIDISVETRTILDRIAPEVRRRASHVMTAIQHDLVAVSDPAAFRQVLTDLVSAALHRAPGGQLIVTASRHGARVEVAVSDDGIVTGLHATESVLRGASQLIAMQGGTLEIDMRPGEGTITTMRLFAPTYSGHRAQGKAAATGVTRAVSAAA